MSTIVELQQRAAALKAKYQKESITPKEIGQLHEDTLAYMAELERYVDNLGVRKTYASKAEMDADVAPVGTNGKAMRYGQLAVIRSSDGENGNIYAYQKPGWLLVGNLNEGQVVNDLVTGGSNVPLSAEQGKVLDKKISDNASAIPAIADNLVTDDSTKALSAAQGKKLYEMITEYDVSAHNGGKAYSLAEAISAVPEEFHRGGMTISFVDVASGEYTIYTCKSSIWSNDISHWLNSDNTISDLSKRVNINTLKINGSEGSVVDYDRSAFSFSVYYTAVGFVLTVSGNRATTDFLEVSENAIVKYRLFCNSNSIMLSVFDASKHLLTDACVAGTDGVLEGDWVVPNGVSYIRCTINPSLDPSAFVRITTLSSPSIAARIEQEETRAAEVEDALLVGLNDIRKVMLGFDQRNISYTNDDMVGCDSSCPAYGANKTTTYTSGQRKTTGLIQAYTGDVFEYSLSNTATVYNIIAYDDSKGAIWEASVIDAVKDGTYTVPEGVSYVCFFAISSITNSITLVKDAHAHMGLKQKVISIEERLDGVDKCKLSDFSEFTKNSNWTVSEDYSTVETLTQNSYLKYVTDTFEDEFDAQVTLVPSGQTFEVGFGKFFAGTAYTASVFAIKHDGSSSYLVVYTNSDTSGALVAKNTVLIDDLFISSGSKITMRIEKRTDSISYFNATISDEFGNSKTIERIGDSSVPATSSGESAGSVCGYGWGYLSLVMLSGERMKASDLYYGYPVSKDLRCIIMGHSYVEGNSISTQKDKRFASLIKQELNGNVAILGHGGESTTYLLNHYLRTFAKWFGSVEYALICLGGNDMNRAVNDSALYSSRVSTFQQNVKMIDEVLQSHGIKTVWLTNNWWYAYGKPSEDAANEWLLANVERCVDIRRCFEGTDGELLPFRFLEDGIHPSVDTHRRIYNCIRTQAPYLF